DGAVSVREIADVPPSTEAPRTNRDAQPSREQRYQGWRGRRPVVEAGGRCEPQRRISRGLEFPSTTRARLLASAYPATREERHAWRIWPASRRWTGRPRSR